MNTAIFSLSSTITNQNTTNYKETYRFEISTTPTLLTPLDAI
jgi:hypothetical protein